MEFSLMKLTPSSLLMNFPITSFRGLDVGGRKIDGHTKISLESKKESSSKPDALFAYFYDICIWPLTKKFGIRSTFIKMQTPDRIVQPLFSYGWRSQIC